MKQLDLDLGRIAPSTGCYHFWSLYWTSWGRPKKQCVRCGWDDELDISHDRLLIFRQIDTLSKDEKNTNKINLLNQLLANHDLEYKPVLGVSCENTPSTESNTPSTDIREGVRGYYQGQPCSVERVLKNGRLKIVTSDLERYTIKPDEFRLQFELPLEETVLGVSCENTPSTESNTPSTEVKEVNPEVNNTPSTNRRGYGTGGGYVQKRVQERKGKFITQYFFCWEEKGKKRSRYIARSLEAEVIRMNAEKYPIKDILAKLNR